MLAPWTSSSFIHTPRLARQLLPLACHRRWMNCRAFPVETEREAFAVRPGHSGPMIVLQVALLGLLTTSSVMMGAALGLYLPAPKKVLAGILAFAAGSLIASLAIELAFEAARELTQSGANVHFAWLAIAGGFGTGAVIYYVASFFLEQNGAALRYPSRFLEYALNRKRRE